MKIAAGKFKEKCLSIIDEVNLYHEEVIITKRGKPKAKMVPLIESQREIYGYMKDSLTIKGDIISSTGEKWNADR